MQILQRYIPENKKIKSIINECVQSWLIIFAIERMKGYFSPIVAERVSNLHSGSIRCSFSALLYSQHTFSSGIIQTAACTFDIKTCDHSRLMMPVLGVLQKHLIRAATPPRAASVFIGNNNTRRRAKNSFRSSTFCAAACRWVPPIMRNTRVQTFKCAWFLLAIWLKLPPRTPRRDGALMNSLSASERRSEWCGWVRYAGVCVCALNELWWMCSKRSGL